jgi:SpoVK/Ycf46/Vps4 family AAA+-type ATPase
VDEMLQGLDKLRPFPNVVCLFTTNLIEDLDPAFVSRCRLKKHIDVPSANGVFEILRDELNQMIKDGEIIVGTMLFEADHAAASSNSDALHYRLLEILSLPWASIHWPVEVKTAVTELRRIASLANGLAGRDIRGIVQETSFTYLSDRDSLWHVLRALEVVVREETDQPAVEIDGTVEPSQGAGQSDVITRILSRFTHQQ